MEIPDMLNFDPEQIDTPAFVVDKGLITKNLKILDYVQKKTGAKILLALKGFAMFSLAPVVSSYLSGTCASSPNEAKLGKDEFEGEVHAHAAAFSDKDIIEIGRYCDHVSFNSFYQKERFTKVLKEINPSISLGLRVNPEESVGSVPIYDPSAPGSRLGIRLANFDEKKLDNIEGLHFHSLCEQNVYPLIVVLKAFEEKFGRYLNQMKWVNFGGGHHITREDYDIEALCKTIKEFRQKYNEIDVYLEPGEAVALNTGFLVTSVLDIIKGSDMEIAICDSSAATHMPDVLEMPYRPYIISSSFKGEKKYNYRIAGPSCLAGDVIGEYSFDYPITVGSKLVFIDMAHYTMVKTNTFNGINLPDITIYHLETDKIEVLKKFGYEDFKSRLS